MRVLALTVGSLAAVAFTVQRSAGVEPLAARVIDRTFVCAPTLIGGERQIGARAHRGSRRHASSWDSPAFAAVSTTVSGAAATVIEDELAWMTAGSPSAAATVVSTGVGFTFPVKSWGTFAVNARRCRVSTSRVPLGPGGLNGGATGPFDERYDCTTSRRILVRVRAAMRSNAALTTYRGFLRTTVPITQGALAVRTDSGKLFVYAQVFESGKALLFTAPRCNPD